MRKKIIVSLISLMLSPYAFASSVSEEAEHNDNVRILKALYPENEEPIYEIMFNKSWKTIAGLKFIDEDIYLLKFEIPEYLKKMIKPESFKIIDEQEYLVIKKDIVVNITPSKLKMDINLDQRYLDNQLILDIENNSDRSLPIDAFIADYNLGYSNRTSKTFLELDGILYKKNGWEFAGGFSHDGEQISRNNFTARKAFDNNNVLLMGEITSNQHSKFNNANMLGLKYSTAYYNQQNSDVSLFTPVLPINGYSVNPTKMDLYVNDNLYKSYDLGVGNYDINLPLTSSFGAGVLKTVILDKYGNPQEIEIPFYTHKDLIKEGRTEYEFNIGALQNNNNSYSRKYGDEYLVDGIIKHGVTDNYSQSLFLQKNGKYSLVDLKADFTLSPSSGFFTLGYSKNNMKQDLLTMNYQSRHRKTSLSYGFNHSRALSNEFCPSFNASCYKEKTSIFSTYTFPKNYGNINLAYAENKNEFKKMQNANLSWNKRLSKNVHLNTGINKSWSQRDGRNYDTWGASISLSISLGDTYSTNHSYVKNQNESVFSNSLYVQEDISNPVYGYGGINSNTSNGKTNTAINYSNKGSGLFQYSLFMDDRGEKVNYTHSVAGSMYYIPEGNMFGMAQKSQGGITLVEIENGTKDIVVLQSNKFAGKTNKDGSIVVTGTSPNTYNNISLDINSIPFDRPVDKMQRDYIAPKTGASKITFKMAIEPFEIKVKGINENALILVNDEYFMINEEGVAIVGFEGEASIELSSGKVCKIILDKKIKEYSCE